LRVVQFSSVIIIRIDPSYVVIVDQFFWIDIFRFVASPIITGSFTEILTPSGEIFWANNAQNHSNKDETTPSINLFIF
jgi:hypothetical protein